MKFKVLKGPVKDKQTGNEINEGEIVDLTVKRVKEFEKIHGKGWFERMDEDNEQ